jgi:DNA-binding MarR family transcriptional regulator
VKASRAKSNRSLLPLRADSSTRPRRIETQLEFRRLFSHLHSLPSSRFDFRCEPFNDCRVGSLGWDDFKEITVYSSELVRTFHRNDVRLWYRLLLRSSSLLNLDLHELVAITLLGLASDFGIKESRGALLKTSFRQQDIADLAGASRPRVTEHLARLEREHLLVRQGRRFIVCVKEIGGAIAVPSSSRVSSQVHRSRKERLLAASNRTANHHAKPMHRFDARQSVARKTGPSRKRD